MKNNKLGFQKSKSRAKKLKTGNADACGPHPSRSFGTAWTRVDHKPETPISLPASQPAFCKNHFA